MLLAYLSSHLFVEGITSSDGMGFIELLIGDETLYL
jgi:hypothetical protein